VYSGNIPDPVFEQDVRMDAVPKWFQGIKLNFAENILFRGDDNGRPCTSPGKEDDKIACVEVREGSFLEPMHHVSWKELRQRVGQLSQAMKAHGVRKGDRIALVASNSLDTAVVFLATTALGAIFSSSSTDMGTKGILERLLQIEPKLLFMDDWALYNGKRTDLRPKMKEVVEGMRGVAAFEGIVSQVRFSEEPADISAVPKCQSWANFIGKAKSSNLIFEPLDFQDPMIIVYSSGTTGQPKCIVHGAGGVVLSGYKEANLHRCVNHTSTQLQFTTTGWIMYMSSIQLLLTGAKIILYDGSPFVPTIEDFIRLLGQEKVTHLGISPRYLQTLQSNDIRPTEVADLSHLQLVTSTGMVLSDALFEWFYDTAFPPTTQLCNISGGTDIAAAFGTSSPLLPVYVGGCQCMALGLDVRVCDSITGQEVEHGIPGELVCIKPFPTMPVMFWGRDGKERYHNSYFDKFDNCWVHGDLIMIHPQTKQVMFMGRADGVLNPSGVRFGSAEIYSVIDAHFTEDIEDSLCIGQRRPQDNDESVLLFLLMKSGRSLTGELMNQIKQTIRKELSPRHVPKYIFETPDIPVSPDHVVCFVH